MTDSPRDSEFVRGLIYGLALSLPLWGLLIFAAKLVWSLPN
jgi:hypothetical protein